MFHEVTVRPSVLVVEEDRAVRELIVRLLENEDCYAVQAPNASKALELLSVFRFDLLLIDVTSPEDRGFDLIRKARCLPRGSAVRIAAMSGDGLAVLHEARRVGAHGTIEKPFTRIDLFPAMMAMMAA